MNVSNVDHVTVYIWKPSFLLRTQVCLCQRWKCKMWCGTSSRNQWKRKDELHPQKKWKRNRQTFLSNPNPRNKYPRKRTASQKSPGLWCSHAIGLHHLDLAYFLIFFYSLLYWSQFPRAAVRHTPGKQTTQELYIQSSLPSGQHPKGETRAETETWVIPEGRLGSFASVPHLVSDMFDPTVDGKLEDGRPSLLVKLLSSSSVPELGHSSGSEGEKEFAAPEWDVPLSKNSLRKTRAKIFLFRPSYHWECSAKGLPFVPPHRSR